MNARTTYTLIRNAWELLTRFAAIIAPCSVKTYGRYLILSPRFKVTVCDLEAAILVASWRVRRKVKSSGKPLAIALYRLIKHTRLDAIYLREFGRENDSPASDCQNRAFNWC